jgi:hypothetical protein
VTKDKGTAVTRAWWPTTTRAAACDETSDDEAAPVNSSVAGSGVEMSGRVALAKMNRSNPGPR